MIQTETLLSPRLDAALRYATAGIPVFPCKPGLKEPIFKGSFKNATTDPQIIHGWFEKYGDCNIALCPEMAGLAVIDLDDKNGKTGSANWRKLVEDNRNGDFGDWQREQAGTNVIPIHITPSGGTHLFFRDSIGPSVGTETAGLGPGIDTRGRGSYVLLPPSVVMPGGADIPGDYEVLIDFLECEAPPLPAWVHEKLRRKLRSKLKARDDFEFDQPWNIDKGRHHLKEQVRKGRVAVPGNRDNLTYEIACEMLEIGLSLETSSELMHELWEPHCVELCDEHGDLIEWKLASAAATMQNEAGSRSDPDPAPLMAYQAAAAPPPQEPDPIVLPDRLFKTLAQIAAEPYSPATFFWDDRMMECGTNYVTGDSNAGKTTLAANIAAAVAGGVPLWGKHTRQMPVFMLIGEDEAGYMREQIMAIRSMNQWPEELLANIQIFSTRTVEIEGGNVLARISDDGECLYSDLWRAIVAEMQPGSLFIIDPLIEYARFNRVKDEPAGAVGRTWGRAINRMGISVIINDHPSKAGMKDGTNYGGSVQIKAGMDNMATLISEEQRGSSPRKMVLKFTKIRQRANHDVLLVRNGSSPAFMLQGGPEHKPTVEEWALYGHCYERLTRGLSVHDSNRGSNHGPAEIVVALGIMGHHTDESAVRSMLKTLAVRQWIARAEDSSEYQLGPSAPGDPESAKEAF